MNEHCQNEKIALYCGWKFDKNQYKQWISPDGTTWNYPPAYTKDLNQMHEAEKVLACTDEGPKTSERRRYLMILEAVIAGPPDRFGDRPNRQLSTPFATVAQRAEAFLHTIGKWEEVK